MWLNKDKHAETEMRYMCLYDFLIKSQCSKQGKKVYGEGFSLKTKKERWCSKFGFMFQYISCDRKLSL